MIKYSSVYHPTYLRYDGVDKSKRSNKYEHKYKLVRVLLELEIDGGRVHDAAYEGTFVGTEGGADHHGSHAFSSIEPRLNNFRAAV